jgi:hypothetical protein
MAKKKGRKEQYVPYMNNGTSCSISYDYKPFLDANGNENGFGEWYYETFKYIPTLATIKTHILNHFNKKVEAEILSGMTWKDMQVWLSSENQFNYKAAYDIAVQTSGKNLPIKFKFGTTDEPIYYNFTDIYELSDFYLSTVQYIQNILEKGWEIKDSIDWDLYDNNKK